MTEPYYCCFCREAHGGPPPNFVGLQSIVDSAPEDVWEIERVRCADCGLLVLVYR